MGCMEDRTSVQVYVTDADWLRTKQRQISFERNEHVPMFDVIRELIKAIRTEGQGA